MQGDKLVEDVDEELQISIPISDEYDTISGYVQYASGKVPEINDIISTDDYVIKILELENKRIKKVKLVLFNAGGSDNE
ncbi:transporter associated domain-containing protein [Oceanivirga miroungae]|uniref:transporter associated domain-containing protein n=1 Tax=Oceanivirga miroungae TaxID=1130046 RepID=UPI0038B31811